MHLLFEKAYTAFHQDQERKTDPVSVVHRYARAEDREIIGLFAAVLAYGNVKIILSNLERILDALGPDPHRFLVQQERLPRLRNFRHRFTTEADIQILASWIASAVRRRGSLEQLFIACPSDRPMRERLSAFVQALTQEPLPPSLRRWIKPRERNLKYLLPSPERGSACKRLNLYLRWMVRGPDAIDLGVWTRVQPKDLILPVDTHLLKLLRELGWTESKTASWKVAEAATERLREHLPHDPIKYDFALCHLSMRGRKLVDFID